MKMTGRTLLAAIGAAALVSTSPILAQGRSGGTPGAGMGQGSTMSSSARGGGMSVGMGAGAMSPNGIGAGSLASGLTGIDRATDATSGNENATAGFANAMDMRAAAQTRRTTARANAQASTHAADKAKEKANENSVLNDPDD
jgi:hypothetical protein